MFKILKDQKATSKDLAETYVHATALEEALSTEKMEIHQKLMELQVDSFDKKPSRELQSLKVKMDDLNTKIEGCKFGREQLKNRLGERLQVESQERLEVIDQELSSLSSEEKTLNQKYLDSAARTAVIRESIRGLTLSHDTKGNYQTSTPSLKVELHLMDLKDGEIYSDRVECYRKELQVGSFGGTIRGRRDDFVQERDRLERLLSGDPIKNAEELLNKLSPPNPEPAPEAEFRKTSQFTRDYDKIGPVDYGTGQELPYKGVGEILHEREMKE